MYRRRRYIRNGRISQNRDVTAPTAECALGYLKATRDQVRLPIRARDYLDGEAEGPQVRLEVVGRHQDVGVGPLYVAVNRSPFSTGTSPSGAVYVV